jgi:histidinol-phosphate aminotransferase
LSEGTPGSPRPAVAGLPSYKPGRSAEMAMAEHDLVDAIKLASNELPWGPLPAVSAAIRAASDTANIYADHRALALRDDLAEATGLDATQVAVGCGSVGLLQQLFLAYVDAGDRVVFPWPSFEAYPVYAATVGADAAIVPLRRQSFDLDAIGAMATSGDVARTKLILLANPNNPTGTAVPIEDVERLLATVPPTCLVVLDEAYREFVTRPDLPDTVTLLADHPNLVVLRTFSKAHALAALRIGYALAHPEVVVALDKVLVPFTVNGIGQAAARAALADLDALRERLAGVSAERARVAAELRRSGWSVPDAQANFVWLPAGDATAGLAFDLERRGVVTRPFPGSGLRVTIGDRSANDRFLEAFALSSKELDPSTWRLPTGELGARVQAELDTLEAVVDRLASHAASPPPPGALTAPDPPTGERWDAGQVWAHLGEFGAYWLPELRRIVDARSSSPVPFGRTKKDAHRIAEIEAHRHAGADPRLSLVRRHVAALAAELSELDAEDWTRIGRHETLGDMDLWTFLGHFGTGHYQEHADQLAELDRG